jgi:hypothetical protein
MDELNDKIIGTNFMHINKLPDTSWAMQNHQLKIARD